MKIITQNRKTMNKKNKGESKMKKIVLGTVIVVTLLVIGSSVYAHSGRTDPSGGHWNHSTGLYHFHGF